MSVASFKRWTVARGMRWFCILTFVAVSTAAGQQAQHPKKAPAAAAKNENAWLSASDSAEPGPTLNASTDDPLGRGRKLIVALDVGHSQADPGAISAYGHTEYSYNRAMVEKIAARLRQSGRVQPFIVNPKGQAISLRLRTELARRNGAKLFLSVHHDSAQSKYLKSWIVDGKPQLYSEAFRGYGVFVSFKNPFSSQSRDFGTSLGREMRQAGFQFSPHHHEPIPGENRPILDAQNGLYRYDDLIVLKTARMPAALLECGVIIHPEEARALKEPGTQERIADAVYAAVERFVIDSPEGP